MERVAFLIEDSNERLRCLLNPETLVIKRLAGVSARHTLGGQLSGAGLADTPLLFTGGGRTELQLDLLFDTALAGSSIQSENVRDLTAPLWQLAENSSRLRDFRRPPQVRFLWGKQWDIPGIVVAVAERLEQFSSGGAPQRSWLRLRLVRVHDESSAPVASPPKDIRFRPGFPTDTAFPGGTLAVHIPTGGAPASNLLPQRELPAVWNSVLTAGGIIDSALKQTYTARALAAAFSAVRDVVSNAARVAGERLTGLVRAIGDSAAIKAIRQVVGEALQAVRRATEATGRAIYNAVTQAAQTLGSAYRRARAAVIALYQEAAEVVSARVAAVADALRPVMAAINETLEKAGSAIQEIIADIGDSPAVRAIREAGQRMGQAIVEFIQSESGLGRAIKAAAGAIGDAFETIRNEAASLGQAAREKIETVLAEMRPFVEQVGRQAADMARFVGTVAIAPIAAAVLDIGKMGVAMGRAGRVVAEAVYPHAARITALSALHLRQGATYAGLALQDAGEGLAETGRAAVETIGNSLSGMQDLAAGLLIEGPETDLSSLWPQLAPVGPALEQLWLAGEGKIVRQVTGHVQQAATAGKAATAAHQALEDVHPQKNGREIEQELDKITETLPQVPELPPAPPQEAEFPELTPPVEEPESVAVIHDSVAQVEALVETLPAIDPGAQQQLQEAVAQLRKEVDGLMAASTVDNVLPAVQRLRESTNAALEKMSQHSASLVKAAAAEADTGVLPPLVGEPAGAAETRLQPGERLDQVAYQHYQDPALWRLLAYFNDLPDPLQLPTGQPLQVPSLADAGRTMTRGMR